MGKKANKPNHSRPQKSKPVHQKPNLGKPEPPKNGKAKRPNDLPSNAVNLFKIIP